jgi:hypothetical protein
MGLGVRQQNPTKGLAKSTTWYWAASSLRRSLARQGLDSWYVAECGKGEPGPLTAITSTKPRRGRARSETVGRRLRSNPKHRPSSEGRHAVATLAVRTRQPNRLSRAVAKNGRDNERHVNRDVRTSDRKGSAGLRACKTPGEGDADERADNGEHDVRPELPIKTGSSRGVPDDRLSDEEANPEANDYAAEYHHRQSSVEPSQGRLQSSDSSNLDRLK